MFPLDDTIAAIASAPGGAARGIVRLSGPNVLKCLRAIFHSSDKQELHAPMRARAIGGSLELAGISAPVPCDLFFWPQERSYTGQIVAEFHTLGSPPLLEALLNSLCAAGARFAERGEFTLRAFLSGRIDLTQAEAVLGVIEASDPHELQVAAAQLAGGLAGPLHRLRDMLLELLAHLEAGFDFADEDLPFITTEQLQSRLDEAAENVARLAAQMESRGTVQTAVRAVLLGQPNSGKSSLFNALTRKEHALVSDLPGTTRDYLVAELDFDGRKCQLIDTAGFREESALESRDSLSPDQAAQTAAAEQIARAHVRLLCLDATRPPDLWEQAELAREDYSHRIVIWTKSDLLPSPDKPTMLCMVPVGARRMAGGEGVDSAVKCPNPFPTNLRSVPGEGTFERCPILFTSSVTGQGLELLRMELRRMAISAETVCGDVVASTAARCRESLDRVGESLQNARDLCRSNSGEEFIAAEIRMALDEIGKVVGAVYTDDVLDRIFSRFCVGK
ncbi:MAG: GTPase [Thermoguttaceae bacterium]|jgi:tRNA modification GTPase